MSEATSETAEAASWTDTRPIGVWPSGRDASAIDRTFALVERLPGPAELWLLAVGVALAFIAQLATWSTGAAAWGVILPDVVIPAVTAGYFLSMVALLNRVGADAFDTFRAVLGRPGREAMLRNQLLSIGVKHAIVGVVLTVVVVSTVFYVLVRPTQQSLPGIAESLSGMLWLLFAATLGLLLTHTVDELRAVQRISREALNVDIFRPEPLTGLARITSVSSIGLLIFVALNVLVSPTQTAAYLVPEGGVTLIAVLAFVLPLRVMHGRLSAEKDELQANSQQRLKSVLSRLHEAVETNDLARADQLEKTLNAVLAERDLLGRLPTWPWSDVTIRGMASAVLLPVGIFILTRAIDRLL
jgi:hypothetical protein